MNQSLKKQENANSYNINEVLDKNCMDYARYILKYRCIPSLEDGLKSIHKRIIFSFDKNGYTHNKPRTKSVNACGGVLKYSPHGDSSVYDASVRLANDSVNINLIDGKGEFSSTTTRDIQAGASRYTEMRLAEVTTQLLRGIKKGNVPMVLTYDESRYEPKFLPSTFPLILCNPNIGIGSGFSTSIASFNLIDVCDYTISMLRDEELPLIVPDFSTGGEYLYNEKELKSIHSTGKGKLVLRAKYHIEGNHIVVTEIPYSTTREQIVESIIKLVNDKVLKDVVDVNDFTGKDGLEINIELKKSVDKERTMALLFQKTSLQDSFSCNFNVLDNEVLKLYGVKQIISRWLVFRRSCLRRELEYDIQQLTTERTKLQGLNTILQDLDKAIVLIRSSKSEKEAMTKLIEEFNLLEEQAEYISTIRLVNMNEEWLHKKVDALASLDLDLAIMESNLNDDDYYKDTIIEQLEEVKKKYGKPRRTTIIEPLSDEGTATATGSKKDTIENFNCTLVVTQEGYIKRNVKYAETQKVKDGDIVTQVIPSTNHSKIMFFTDKANVYFCNGWDLPTHTPSTLGTYIPSTLGLDNEKIVHVVSTSDFKGWLLFAYANGKVAKVTLNSYQTKTNRSKMVNGYNLDSELVSITHITQNQDFQAVSSIDKILVVDTAKIGEKSAKTSQGVNVLKSKNDSVMVEFKPVDIENPEYYKANPNATGKYRK